MKECEAPGLIGQICRGIPGVDESSCYFIQAIEMEDSIDGLRGIIGMAKDIEKCPFRERVLQQAREKIQQIQEIFPKYPYP
ncbi:MAG: hypothetical protein M1142_04360 [Patescibacteria group bacterium]|nr:hypothetical protein [Patescibacteria group bacterium]